MPLSEQVAAGLCYMRLSEQVRARVQIPHIVAFMRRAREDLALWVIENGDDQVRALFRQTFASLPITAGVASISTLLAADEMLVAKSLPFGDLRDSSQAEDDPSWQFLPSVEDLRMERAKAFVYYALDGTNLRTRNRDGALTTLDGVDLTITAYKALTVAGTPRNLEERFLEILRGLVLMGQAGQVEVNG